LRGLVIPEADAPALVEADGVNPIAPAVPAPEDGFETAPSSMTEPETDNRLVPVRADAVIEEQNSLESANGPHRRSSSPELAMDEASDDPAHADDSVGSSPATRWTG
jgi:hypothetical protein